MRKPLALAVIFVGCIASSVVVAQQPNAVRATDGGSSEMIQVSVSYSLSVPLPDDDERAQTTALEKGRRMVYEMAARECKVLEETIATTCKLERLGVQSNIHHTARSREHVGVSANVNFRIKLK